MDPSSIGAGAGAYDLNFRGSGLKRFRSAPATSWLNALLSDDTTNTDPLKPSSSSSSSSHHQQQQHHNNHLTTNSLTHLLTSSNTNTNNNTHIGVSSDQGGFLDLSGTQQHHYSNGGGHNSVGGVNLGFHRQNSSPADFIGGHVDGFFASFGIPASYDNNGYLGGSSSSTGKRAREAGGDSGQTSNFMANLKKEQHGQMQAGGNGMLDLEMERMMEDSVPWRIRAKRGCATHPRSIAERVRRTRISDRIRKLQELVPNMDKQTNTADMLDEAVDYVKRLQEQIQELTNSQKKCKCIPKT
ncbi:hypothetical protein Droror1_Dr00015141 [Drosera rotundifolia]